MSSVCSREFLAHPIEKKKHSLIEHLLEVAKKSKYIFSQTNFANDQLAFYSGLLHDIGKINPFYQKIFYETKNREKIEEEALKKYVREHSRFSAWAAEKLLCRMDLDCDTIDKIMILIYGHHSTIRKSLGSCTSDPKFITTQKAIGKKMQEFHLHSSKIPEISRLDWDACIKKFSRPMEFDVELKSKSSPYDYLEMSYAFSCLLQADRGSFSDWNIPNFDLQLNTKLFVGESKLSGIRNEFQKYVMKKFDASQEILVINAPTGIGKTKVFLDIINRYAKDNDVQRVFYFSPLLALTEDFEEKISKNKIVPKEQHSEILIYNHLHSVSLQEKNQKNTSRNNNSWVFENESFNRKFIITTTQRLLMSIYSNKARDKMKFASFRNSVLIIDEVQTIPKPILSNLKEIFENMNKYMNTKIILISATIPHEIRDIKRIELKKEILREYLKQTKKQISMEPLVIETIPIEETLVMANTRKRAAQLYHEIKQMYTEKKIIYLSTGIRKKDRINLIKELPNMSKYILVSTQVVEAGVDISFSHIFRECAPLDNIIQVMGRLNRDGTNPDSKLIIYPSIGNSPIPYSRLEFQTTQEKIKHVTNSIQVYDVLEKYYEKIYNENLSNIDGTEKLQRNISRLDFDGTWDFVRNMIFNEYERDTIFIPEIEEYDSIKSELMYSITNKMSQKSFKKFGELTASLPISLDKIGYEHFDNELMDENILMPKKEHLETIYHRDVGLDKWLL